MDYAEHSMSCAKTELHNALRSIAKTMQDASEIEPVAVVNAQIGDAA